MARNTPQPGPYLSPSRARSGTLISLLSTSSSGSSQPQPQSQPPRSSLQLLNPSSSPYTALTPGLDIPSPVSGGNNSGYGGADDGGGGMSRSLHSMKTLPGGTRYYDEYDEDEWDNSSIPGPSSSTSGLRRSPSNSSLSRTQRSVTSGQLRAIPAARPRSASTVIDITPYANAQGSSLHPPGNPNPSSVPSRTPRARSISSVSIASNSSFHGLHLAPPSFWRSFALDRPVLAATLQAVGLMVVCAVLLGGVVWMLLPPISDEDSEKVSIPRSFEDLKALNGVLQVYKENHYYRVLGSYILIYLFLQAFSLPGSMYLSMLAGAMYGVVRALPLVCGCVASGALLCYTLSAHLGPPLLLHSATWRHRLEAWRIKLASRSSASDLFSYLVVLRISPLPPHWVVNILAPHIGIPRGLFFGSTFFGIAGVSLIHVQLGTTLDSMAEASELTLWNSKNLLGLAAIAAAVMLPVAMRYFLKSEVEALAPGGTVPPTEGEAAELRVAAASARLVVIKDEDGDGDDADARSLIGHAPLDDETEWGDDDDDDDDEEEDEGEEDEDEDRRRMGRGVRVLGGPQVVPEGKAARILGVASLSGGSRGSSGGRGK